MHFKAYDRATVVLILTSLDSATVLRQQLLNYLNFLLKSLIVKTKHAVRVHDLHFYFLHCFVVGRHDSYQATFGRSDHPTEQIDYDLLQASLVTVERSRELPLRQKADIKTIGNYMAHHGARYYLQGNIPAHLVRTRIEPINYRC